MKHLNLIGLARVFKKSTNTVKSWVSAGCPCVSQGGHGKAWKFDLPDVLAWREDQLSARVQSEDLAEARRRRATAEASLAELQLAREQGTLVAADEVQHFWGTMVATMRARLLAIPTKCAAQAAASTPAGACETISAAINEALTELADNGLPNPEQAS